jgi:hypothetical protein
VVVAEPQAAIHPAGFVDGARRRNIVHFATPSAEI